MRCSGAKEKKHEEPDEIVSESSTIHETVPLSSCLLMRVQDWTTKSNTRRMMAKAKTQSLIASSDCGSCSSDWLGCSSSIVQHGLC